MCGIAGWLGKIEDEKKWAKRMVQALHNRGPDSQGIQSWSKATLIHTRLSVIDLSPNGAQPMSNEDRTVWTVFNGEIYNHRELRHWLESRGHVFKGHSDTEVLPHLYEEEGWQFVNRLRGMFALAIYDLRSQTLILARDRFGIKPLFYAPGVNHLVFGSEIRAILECPEIDTTPDRQAIYDFAALCYIPAPETFYTGIRALQPGEVLQAELNIDGVSLRTRIYHRWAITPNHSLTLEDAVNRADQLITAGVHRQLESDVPLGTLLSGGIDSSLVTVAAQSGLEGGLQTFNVRFPGSFFDETWAARATAEHIGSYHRTIDMDEGKGKWGYVRELLSYGGQPFADPALLPLNAICRVMKQHVTVALSGDGGDEGFGGYDSFWWINAINRWQSLARVTGRGVFPVLNLLIRLGIVPERLSSHAQELSVADNTSIIQYLHCRIREEEHNRLCIDKGLLPIRRLFEPQWDNYLSPKASRLERLSAHVTEINLRSILPDYYLFKCDTASMKESLEVRVPLLDEDVVDFGLSLPHNLKVRGRTCKRVLRKIACKKLPSAVANKPKGGFILPMGQWVDEDFKAQLKETLLSPSCKLTEFFRPEVYQPIVKAFCDGKTYGEFSQVATWQRVLMFLSLCVTMDRSVSRIGTK